MEAGNGWELRKIKLDLDNSKKGVTIRNDKYGLKDYMKRKALKDVRDIFAERNFMLPFAGNYKGDKRFKSSNWKCLLCRKEDNVARLIEDQDHILICDGYSDLHHKYDLDSDEGRMLFFRDAVRRRDEAKEEERFRKMTNV